MTDTQLQQNKPWLGRLQKLIVSIFLCSLFLTLEQKYAIAIDDCQSPGSGEYLLVIVTTTPENQDIVRRTLPPDIIINVCRYISLTVSSIRGFDDKDVASDWAKYVQDIVGLPAYVVKPSQETKPPNNRLAAPPEIGFNPEPLGSGYAVLVDYNNQPEIALQLERSLGRNLGLVAYGQKPFLLVTYTKKHKTATNSMFNLSDRGFLVFIVDSSKVTLISPKIQLPN
ncbi:hypothetical protein [Okeania sp.]|uniref:hypothetical protein n=1 Tax=Okeania sp. TaxID=3100323 RepID=UPI002B4AD064|nr:hypothetical protein [Okeania sp.]MEB3339723.1 hypothetical protein [Okeania sp.]